jgi:Reverse transcriptase (RNA-dependent DNA polymerase)
MIGDGLDNNHIPLSMIIARHIGFLHVLWCCETRLIDFSRLYEARKGLTSSTDGETLLKQCRVYAMRSRANNAKLNTDDNGDARPRSQQHCTGGGCFLVFDKDLEVHVLCNDPLGMLSISIQRKGFRPIALIGVYIPPKGTRSRFADGSTWQERLLRAIIAEERRLSAPPKGKDGPTYSAVIIVGDFNMRDGDMRELMKEYGLPPRVTDDVKGKDQAKTFRWFLRSMDAMPVSGTPNQPPGRITSRPPATTDPTNPDNKGSEVDFVVARRKFHRFLQQRALSVTFADLPDSMTHLPIAFNVYLQRYKVKRVTRTNRGLPPLANVSYRDVEANHVLATKVMPAFRNAIVANETKSIDEQYQAAVSTYYEKSRDSICRKTLIRSGNRAYSTKYSPAALCRSLREQRQKILHLQALIRDGQRLGRSSEHLAPLLEDLKMAKQERKVLQREHRRNCRKVMSDMRRALLDRLAVLNFMDPRSMFKEVNAICPLDPMLFSDSDPKPPMEVSFPHYSTLSKESRPPVRAIVSGEYDDVIPQPKDPTSATSLAKPFHWTEVYLATAPIHEELLEEMEPCRPDCTECISLMNAIRRWIRFDPSTKRPHCSSLNQTSAAGSDRIRPAGFRFSRHATDYSQWYPERVATSMALCSMYNRWLEHKCVPTSADAVHNEITALVKNGAPGRPADPYNPKDTRGISVGNVLLKIFSLLLNRRLQHWCIDQGIISSPQIGFMPKLGAEMHVFTALQTFSLLRLAGWFASALFVDITGAYDNVQLEALLYVLTKIGLPSSLVDLFRNWFSSRTACVKIGAEVSERFSADKGLPQGDVLSPLLWNIFFETLVRKLDKEVKGISIRGRVTDVRFSNKKLIYADDLMVMSQGRNPKAVRRRTQAALNVILAWSEAWGVRINTKPGKTEAMFFAPDFKAGDDPTLYCSSGSTPGLVPLDAGPAPDGEGRLEVHWVKEYRYLGFPLTLDLASKAYTKKRASMLKSVIFRFFGSNETIPSLPYNLQVQLAMSLCLGQINYLTGVVWVQQSVINKMNSILRALCRRIFKIPRSAPQELMDLLAPFLTADSILLSNSVRIRKSLQLLPPPYDRSPGTSLPASWPSRRRFRG